MRLEHWRSALKSPVGAASASLLAVLAVLAVVAPMIWGDAANETNPAALSQGRSAEHLLGTDALGRDIALRVLVATRYSLGLALLATSIAVLVGLVLGVLPAVLGRRGSRFVTAAVNLAVAFPALLLALFFAVIFGVGAQGAVLAIGFAGAPSFARLVQTNVAAVAGRDYVAAARVAGVGRTRLVLRHLLPNAGEPLVVNATVMAGTALLAFAGLSFLGIGVQPPAYDWGRLLGEGLDRIYINPAASLAPGVAVVLAGLAFTLLGEAIAQVVGIRTARRRMPEVRPEAQVASSSAAAVRDTPATDAVLDVRDLRVGFAGRDGWTYPVDGVSLTVWPGETVGIVGESGSGKSLTALAVARLAPDDAAVSATRLDVNGTSLLDRGDAEVRKLLGTSVAMVFQDPMTSFNPSMRVGAQLAEVTRTHEGRSRRDALSRAVDRLRKVHIPSPQRRARQYPHEYSGGMRQRAMIGMGLMSEPALIIADEPTTALDVTVQRQVLRLLRDVQRDTGAAVLLISHDIAVVSQMCERIIVMYAGRVVEELPVDRLAEAAHPYTRALLGSVPDMTTDREKPLVTIPGRPPEPADRPPGCAFAPRCGFADELCGTTPELEDAGPRQRAACWHPRTEAIPPVAQAGVGERS
ncbi:dipeptide/oligopeptide/nickel ABC transporter permease/ATP-binding protein [Phytoactinopolyspora alkaliphila]|uniref:Dipeptide/oligopeptide/nickel ABC transporter permease/ATP-binding protein n=1 Tax=Phytoactinopolyspora alkaliphila TaxID=1783498 RepID=A0A6N9YMR2_9ACTN|nr:dipeptide/oligopeptide/nickel ABC transporter permease/ATP-binding protein [Phytoactinopolyspora alkaliphila]NED96273.1 dipeptide/oligopeptide/nickel ABC transporter permease/ATP-binding protein [Phytoactinopolyspora alkaliphila]